MQFSNLNERSVNYSILQLGLEHLSETINFPMIIGAEDKEKILKCLGSPISNSLVIKLKKKKI